MKNNHPGGPCGPLNEKLPHLSPTADSASPYISVPVLTVDSHRYGNGVLAWNS